MRIQDGVLHLSGSDLVGYLNCRHLTELELAVSKGTLGERPFRHDPILETLRQRGDTHEKGYIDHLRAKGLEISEIRGKGVSDELAAATRAEMEKGVPVIVQGALLANGWGGRPDILRRVEVPSALGAYSYEVIDTKLASVTKGSTILQLCFYSELLGVAQGHDPECMYVVAPWTDFEPQTFRVSDYAAYYRHVKAALQFHVSQDTAPATYPERKPHCDVCSWEQVCNSRRREDDHLCLVAGISKIQISELKDHGIFTTVELAEMPLPLGWKPKRGSAYSYVKVREQARVQVQGHNSGRPIYEILPIQPQFGLTRLPSPSPGDLFFDLEGDPFVGLGGREFLFGYVTVDDREPRYEGLWALSPQEEKQLFEMFIDLVIARRKQFSGMHIYHYAPYEPSALKRLMGRYATREEELDQILRSKLFVDLYAIARHSVRASVESYSIKRLEVFYNFQRTMPLRDVGSAMARVQAGLELNRIRDLLDEDRKIITAYNRDDCFSTLKLRDWFEQLRAEQIQSGVEVARPTPPESAASENVTEHVTKVNALVDRLTSDVPADLLERSKEQQARWILANILDWHRREEKSAWWELFRLQATSEEDLLDERAGLAGLEYLGPVEAASKRVKVPTHRYRFPPQETEIRGEEELHFGARQYGSVERISFADRTVDIKKRSDTAALHASAVFAHNVVGSKQMAESLQRLGGYVAANGLTGDGKYQAARDLLLKVAPRTEAGDLRLPFETTLEAACRLICLLTEGIFPVQGPPGSGKTYTGARMICELVRAGKKVGITANSHKVIRNMLDEVRRAAGDANLRLCCVQKAKEKFNDEEGLICADSPAKLFNALNETCSVAGGTAWIWSSQEAFEVVDVLFVDEAAQISLANVLAVAQAAKCVVLLGDPRQLDQPGKGSHPEGTDISALDHVLDGHQTIPNHRGLFLEETWRLHPDICKFTSEVFYEDRLAAREGTASQMVKAAGAISGTGLRYLPVAHEGNQNSSPEEADQIRALVENILGSSSTWVDRDGQERTVTSADILIVAPYNAQVYELRQRLPHARIGTVDKFQGQEAPISIYSMTTSTHADAPRGMEFLYSLNRLNVATSRAKCVCILVGSPKLLEADCRTPRQMQLANAFCRYVELAGRISL